MNTKKIGEISEAQIVALFLKNGISVSIPFGDSEKYDLIVDENNVLIKVQCKTAKMLNGAFKFNTTTSDRGKLNPNTTRKNYIGKSDIFAVYLRETDSVYIFNVNNSPLVECTARLDRKKNCRAADDHLFDSEKSLLDYK